jgi:hypothetical protein
MKPRNILKFIILFATLYSPIELSRIVILSWRGYVWQIDTTRMFLEVTVFIWLPYLIALVVLWRLSKNETL